MGIKAKTRTRLKLKKQTNGIKTLLCKHGSIDAKTISATYTQGKSGRKGPLAAVEVADDVVAAVARMVVAVFVAVLQVVVAMAVAMGMEMSEHAVVANVNGKLGVGTEWA